MGEDARVATTRDQNEIHAQARSGRHISELAVAAMLATHRFEAEDPNYHLALSVHF